MCSYKIWKGETTTKYSRIPWQTIVMCLYLILALMKISSCEAMPSIKEFFFPTLGNNLIRITWAHGVYNDASFQQALKDKSMMIVGDVTLNTRGLSSKTKFKLIMKDSSSNKKGMSLNTFLQKAADAKSVAVKLNFDNISAFSRSVKVLHAMNGELEFPLWLNLDSYYMEDRHVDEFLSVCTRNFPKATISINFMKEQTYIMSLKGYTPKLIASMKHALTRNNVTQTVAFPVEINEAVYSQDTLLSLIKDVHGIIDSSIYLYGFDPALKNLTPYPNLEKLIKDFGKDRVYLDGPKSFVELYI